MDIHFEIWDFDITFNSVIKLIVLNIDQCNKNFLSADNWYLNPSSLTKNVFPRHFLSPSSDLQGPTHCKEPLCCSSGSVVSTH